MCDWIVISFCSLLPSCAAGRYRLIARWGMVDAWTVGFGWVLWACDCDCRCVEWLIDITSSSSNVMIPLRLSCYDVGCAGYTRVYNKPC